MGGGAGVLQVLVEEPALTWSVGPDGSVRLFRIVDWLFGLAGGSESMWQVGSLFFKFWSKQPL